jgi:hypothetical protein
MELRPLQVAGSPFARLFRKRKAPCLPGKMRQSYFAYTACAMTIMESHHDPIGHREKVRFTHRGTGLIRHTECER